MIEDLNRNEMENFRKLKENNEKGAENDKNIRELENNELDLEFYRIIFTEFNNSKKILILR